MMDHSSPLRVGAAMIDITPRAGTHLGGDWGVFRPAEVIGEPLYTRAIVLDHNGKKICIASPDLEIVMGKYTRRIRDAAAQRCGIAPHDTMVHLAQAHSTPPLGNFIIDEAFPNIPPEHEYLRGSQEEYCDFAAAKTIEAIELADRRLQPVQMAAGSAARDDLAFNRRAVTRDGKVMMPWFFSQRQYPLGPTHIRHMEGPSDPEVGVVCFRDAAMNMVAMLLHFTCHPVNMYALNKHVVTPDWPGAWAGGMQARYGAACVPIVLNGCCGDVNPWPPFAAGFLPDHQRMGAELAKTSERIIETLRFGEPTQITSRLTNLPLPIKKLDPAKRAEAEKLLRENPAPLWMKDNLNHATWEWMDAAMMMSVELERERSADYPYEIQTFRIGDLALVGLPGEPFASGQLQIKIGSPAYPTYVAHGTTDYAGYIAPRDAYPRGGHEIRDTPAKWAKLAPGALEAIVETSIADLKALWRSCEAGR